MPQSVEGLVIRSANPDDAEWISKMIHELALYEKAPESCHATPVKVTEQLFGKSPKGEALIAELHGEYAGFLVFFHTFSTWECAPGIWLEDIFVRPAFRRKGVGEALLKHLATTAVRRGCRRMELAVLDWNKPARDFYEKIGSRAMSEWIIYRMEVPEMEVLAKTGVPSRDRPKAPRPDPSQLPVVISTDGGARPNPGVGAWAAIVRSGSERAELTGSELGTTNNRMEMSAAIGALESLGTEPREVTLRTDSAYLKNGITSWMKNWKKNDWRTKTGAVKNRDLWQRLDALCQLHKVSWDWVRGHAGDGDNERCDELCTQEIEKLVSSSTKEQRDRALEVEARRQEAEERGEFFGMHR